MLSRYRIHTYPHINVSGSLHKHKGKKFIQIWFKGLGHHWMLRTKHDRDRRNERNDVVDTVLFP